MVSGQTAIKNASRYCVGKKPNLLQKAEATVTLAIGFPGLGEIMAGWIATHPLKWSVS